MIDGLLHPWKRLSIQAGGIFHRGPTFLAAKAEQNLDDLHLDDHPLIDIEHWRPAVRALLTPFVHFAPGAVGPLDLKKVSEDSPV